jgi:GTPase SAR1 family protein
MSSSDNEILATLKILIIGESGVGKSSLLLRFTDDKFDQEMAATIGVDFKGKFISYHKNKNLVFFCSVKQLEVDNNCVKLAIWVRIKFAISSVIRSDFLIGYSRSRTFPHTDPWLYVFLILIL